ncbi:MAG: HD-GYP domain-containing protein [Gammaproteobacteria bacterium]
MLIDTVKLPVRELTLGMQVVRLDRPWEGTPFLLQGFRIKTVEELKQLQALCAYVYVDFKRGITPPTGRGERVMLNEDGETVEIQGKVSGLARSERPRPAPARVEAPALPPPAQDYPITAAIDAELSRARAAIGAARQGLRQVVGALRDGLLPSLEPLTRAAGELVDSLVRNPDAAVLLRALTDDAPFSARHAVDAAIVALVIGRGLGLRRYVLEDLALGLLVADLGKLRLPAELLRAPRRLDAGESETVKLHVQHSLDIVRELGGLRPGVLEVVAGHHERFDGSGYPRGLVGAAIPLSARIAGLADAFTALTSARGYAEPVAQHEAVQELYAASLPVFQRELVGALIQGLGTHPIGSLVELGDGSIALVVAQNRERRLLPVVLTLSDAARRPLPARRLRNLAGEGGPMVKGVLSAEEAGLPAPSVELLYA